MTLNQYYAARLNADLEALARAANTAAWWVIAGVGAIACGVVLVVAARGVLSRRR